MAELRSWQPGYLDRLKYGIAGLMGDDRQSVRDAEKITSLLEYAPGVGDAMAGAEAVDAFNEGSYGTAGLLGAAAAAGLVPGVGDAVQKGAKQAANKLRVYHGTNEAFDVFDPNRTRTAKHLYTTPNKEDAANYGKNVLEFDVEGRVGDFRAENRGPEEMAALQRAYEGGLDDYFESFDDFLEAFDQGDMYQRFANSYAQDDTIGNLLAEGYDALRIPDAGFQGSLSESIVAADPNVFRRSAGLLGVGDAAAKGIKAAVKSRGDEVLGLLKAGRAEEVTDDMLDMGNAADNANLNAYLFENYDLPMDEASRMARAQEMGLPDNYYHGTASEVPAFDRGKRGQATNAMSAKRATWMADQPSVAEGYATFAEGGPVQQLIDASYRAEADGNWDLANDLMRQAEELEQSGVSRGGNVMPLRGPDDVKVYDADGERYDASDYVLMDKVKEAQAEKRKGLRIDNFVDNADYSDYTEASHLGVFNPADIRSRFARFDPRLKHLRNLSAGLGGLGLLGAGGAAYNAEQDGPAPLL